jgi:hypothetical protein
MKRSNVTVCWPTRYPDGEEAKELYTAASQTRFFLPLFRKQCHTYQTWLEEAVLGASEASTQSG